MPVFGFLTESEQGAHPVMPTTAIDTLYAHRMSSTNWPKASLARNYLEMIAAILMLLRSYSAARNTRRMISQHFLEVFAPDMVFQSPVLLAILSSAKGK
jgi:hypothetical protein